MTFKQKVLHTIEKYDLLKRNERVLAGVSGGPDSLALLYCLVDLQKEFNLKVYVAHLDHCLRQDSYKDAEFVKKIADKLDLPVSVSRVDIKRLSSKGSLEEIARNARHKFFAALAKKYSLKKIVLGHNQDDQAETVLMRILRGSGLYGLLGIAAKRNIQGLTFVRPLIETSRKEIESFLKQKRISARIDPTNLKPVFFRNRVRYGLIPVMEEKFDKNIRNKLSTLAQVLSADYEYLDKEAKEKFKRILTSKTKAGLCLNLKSLRLEHISMQRMILRLSIKSLLGSTRKFGFSHWQEIEDLIANRPDSSIVDLPKKLSIKKYGSRLKVYIRKG